LADLVNMLPRTVSVTLRPADLDAIGATPDMNNFALADCVQSLVESNLDVSCVKSSRTGSKTTGDRPRPRREAILRGIVDAEPSDEDSVNGTPVECGAEFMAGAICSLPIDHDGDHWSRG
jgi:hypothetical protein